MGQTLTGAQAVEMAQMPTALLSDALDEAALFGVISGPRPQRMDQGRVVGQALTVKFEPRSRDPEAYRFGGGVGRPLEQVLKTMQAGHMVVMDLEGSTTAAAWGSLASRLALRRGVHGTILSGACRDVEEIREIGYPVWSLGTCPRRSRNEFTFGSIHEPIRVEGVTIHSGDVIVADQTGIVCIPVDELDKVLDLARQIAAQETDLVARVSEDNVVSWDQV